MPQCTDHVKREPTVPTTPQPRQHLRLPFSASVYYYYFCSALFLPRQSGPCDRASVWAAPTPRLLLQDIDPTSRFSGTTTRMRPSTIAATCSAHSASAARTSRVWRPVVDAGDAA